MPTHRILRPPPRIQRAEAILRGVQLPVQLRCEIVDPPLTQPFARVGVRLLEGVESVDALRVSRTPYAEGADADGDPRLRHVHPLIECRDKIVDVVPAPIVAIRPVLAP